MTYKNAWELMGNAMIEAVRGKVFKHSEAKEKLYQIADTETKPEEVFLGNGRVRIYNINLGEDVVVEDSSLVKLVELSEQEVEEEFGV